MKRAFRRVPTIFDESGRKVPQFHENVEKIRNSSIWRVKNGHFFDFEQNFRHEDFVQSEKQSQKCDLRIKLHLVLAGGSFFRILKKKSKFGCTTFGEKYVRQTTYEAL